MAEERCEMWGGEKSEARNRALNQEPLWPIGSHEAWKDAL